MGWENLEHGRKHLCIRRGITVILVIATLAAGWFITQQSSSLRQRHAANANLPSFADCKVVGNFLANNTLQLCKSGQNNTALFCTQCYCIQGAVDAHKHDGLRGMFDFATEDEECSTKGGFAETYVTSQTLSLIGAVIVVVANQLLRTIMKALSSFEQYKSVTSSSRALAQKFLVAQLINTAVVILVVNAAIESEDAFSWIFAPFKSFGMFLGEFVDFSKEWYSSVGTPLVVTLCLNVFTPHIAPLAQYLFIMPLRRYCCSSRQVTQRDLNSIQAGPQFEITTRSAQMLNHLITTMIFAPGMPLLYPIACAAFLVFYFVDLFLLLKFYQRPPSYNSQIAEFTVNTFTFSILLHLGFSIWSYGNPNVLASLDLSEAAAGTASVIHATIRRSGDFQHNTTLLITNSTGSESSWDKFITISEREEYLQGTIFETMINRIARGNTFPLFLILLFLISYSVFSRWFHAAWKLIANIFFPGWGLKTRLRYNPPLTSDFVRPLDPLMKEENASSLRNLDIGWDVLFNKVEYRNPENNILLKGKAGHLVKRSNDRESFKKTWEVIKESGLHTYDIAINPKYSDAMKLLKERTRSGRNKSLYKKEQKKRRVSLYSWDSCFVCCAGSN